MTHYAPRARLPDDGPGPSHASPALVMSQKDHSLADQGDAGRGVGSGHGDGPAVSVSVVSSWIGRGIGLSAAEMLLASSAALALMSGWRKSSSLWRLGAASCRPSTCWLVRRYPSLEMKKPRPVPLPSPGFIVTAAACRADVPSDSGVTERGGAGILTIVSLIVSGAVSRYPEIWMAALISAMAS
jgi:hypothetical protein